MKSRRKEGWRSILRGGGSSSGGRVPALSGQVLGDEVIVCWGRGEGEGLSLLAGLPLPTQTGSLAPHPSPKLEGPTRERGRGSVCVCVQEEQHVQIDTDIWMDGFELYHFRRCDRSHSINPREQYCQEKHSDIIKNSILQLNSIMNCNLKAGF